MFMDLLFFFGRLISETCAPLKDSHSQGREEAIKNRFPFSEKEYREIGLQILKE